jgi:Kef-type K+ transport system membrane component KefB
MMFDYINNVISVLPISAAVIISIALMLFGGFAMTRLTKLARLPNVTAYILAGIILGPYCFNLVPQSIISGMDFISDIALAFIAFGVGEFFKIETLKKGGTKVIILTIFETLMATLLVFIFCYFILRLELAFSVVLAALASATAPASTMMTIRQTGSKGPFVDTLLQVVALDDVVGLIAYSIAISIALAKTSGGNLDASVVWIPIIQNIVALVIGGIFGFLLKLLMPKKRTTDNRLIVLLGVLFTFCGICTLLNVSPLLGCMIIGMVYINLTNDDKLFLQINYFSPPILLLFFVRSGLGFRIDALTGGSVHIGAQPLILIAVIYFIVRIAGKYLGSFVGASITKLSKEIRNYLGLALIPQAGVAIGLAAMGARTLGGESGAALETIILASSILYELVGPVSAKLSLTLSKSYSDKLEEIAPIEVKEGKKMSEVELLIERIHKIREELSVRQEDINPAEQAFTEAAEEQLEAMQYPQKRGIINRLR